MNRAVVIVGALIVGAVIAAGAMIDWKDVHVVGAKTEPQGNRLFCGHAHETPRLVDGTWVCWDPATSGKWWEQPVK